MMRGTEMKNVLTGCLAVLLTGLFIAVLNFGILALVVWVIVKVAAQAWS